jgi:hypothetical protein
MLNGKGIRAAESGIFFGATDKGADRMGGSLGLRVLNE